MMIYKFITGIVLMIFTFGVWAHPGHGEHIGFFNSIHLQQIFDVSGLILLIMSMLMLKLSTVKHQGHK